MIKLEDIKNYMLNSILNTDYNEHKTDYYDDDGHCGDLLYYNIIEFWRNFNTIEDFKYVVSGKYASDDLDLDGGRSYLLSDDDLICMLHEYLTTVLKFNKIDYENMIYNSVNLTDSILEKYDNDTKIKNVWENFNFNDDENNNTIDKDAYIKNLEKENSELKELLNNIKKLLFL